MVTRSPESDKKISTLSRRELLRAGVASSVGTLLAVSACAGSETPVEKAVQSMSALTGVALPLRWSAPTAQMVAIILEDSVPLRARNLGEIEPATRFSAD